MRSVTHTLKELGSRRIIFSLVVLAYVGWLAIINALMFLPALGWLPENVLSAMGHFGDFLGSGDTHNLIHELVFAFIVGTAAVGLLVQLRNPLKNMAGQWVALIAWISLIVTALITNNWVPQTLFIIFGGLTLLATIFHPAGRGLFIWFSASRINRILLGLTIIAAAPLLVYASINISLQRGEIAHAQGFLNHGPSLHDGNATEQPPQQPATGVDVASPDDEEAHDEEHAAQGHYRNMAAFSFIVILAGLLASFKPSGWRVAAWVAGGLLVLLGLASVVLPDAESSLDIGWGIIATIWGIVFVSTAELTRQNKLSKTRTA